MLLTTNTKYTQQIPICETIKVASTSLHIGEEYALIQRGPALKEPLASCMYTIEVKSQV